MEAQGWIAFVIVTLILLLYRLGEANRRAFRDEAVRIIINQRDDALNQLSILELERNQAVTHAFELERGAAVIRMSSTFNTERRQWEIPEDILKEKDEMGDAERILRGPCSTKEIHV